MLLSDSSTKRFMNYLTDLHAKGEPFIYYRRKIFSAALGLLPMEIDQIVNQLIKKQRLYVFSVPGGRYLRLASEDLLFPTLRHTHIFLFLGTQRVYKANLHPLAFCMKLSIREVKPFLTDLLESGDIQLVTDENGRYFALTEAGELKRGQFETKESIAQSSTFNSKEDVLALQETYKLNSFDKKLLNYIQTNQPVFLNYTELSQQFKLTKGVARQIVNRLIELNYLTVIPYSNMGNALVIHPEASKPYRSFIADQTLVPYKLKLVQHLQKNHPVLYSIRPLAAQLGIPVSELKRVITSLEEQSILEIKGVSGVGNCLVLVEASGLLKMTFNPLRRLSKGITSVKAFVKNRALKAVSKLVPKETTKEITTTLYLVDTENVPASQLNTGLTYLSEQDQVFLMKSQRTSRYEQSLELKRCLAQVKSFEHEVNGKNALDFVIISEATRQLMSNPHQKLCIVSHDRGFDAALGHLTDSLKLSQNQICRCVDFFLLQA